MNKRNRRHGERGYNPTPEYRTWRAMRARCKNPNLKEYPRYGGRGITVCESWHTFENFLADMGRRPTLGYTIDRIDVNQGYFKENCRWATAVEQSRNRSNNVLIEIDGVTKTMVEWAIIHKIKKSTINKRIKRGWSAIDAVLLPVEEQVWLTRRKNAAQHG
jgi:hypothetical protein